MKQDPGWGTLLFCGTVLEGLELPWWSLILHFPHLPHQTAFSIFSSGWPQAHDSPAFISWVLELLLRDTILASISFFFLLAK